MKPDEQKLLSTLLPMESPVVRDVIKSLGMNHKRAVYILEKWAAKGWYDYGVTVDLGWLYPEALKKSGIDTTSID